MAAKFTIGDSAMLEDFEVNIISIAHMEDGSVFYEVLACDERILATREVPEILLRKA